MPTAVGLDYLAATAFSGLTQISTWYMGIIDLAGFSALNFNDTMASHVGWREFIQYSGSRPTWANQESGQQVTSSGNFTFPITGSGTIHGMFATSQSGIGVNNGTLWATAILSSDASVSPGQSLTGVYSVVFSGS